MILWEGGGAKLCRPFLVSCNISTMITITISAIHQSWCTRTVRPHNSSAIHAFPLAIFCLAVGESPLKIVLLRWDHGKDMLNGTAFWMLSWGHTSAEMYIVDWCLSNKMSCLQTVQFRLFLGSRLLCFAH